MNNMVISSNEQATRIHGMYNRNVGQMNAAMTRIATAQKINSAKDNASVWAISQKMRERMRANDQANQNVQNDSALLKTAQGGLDNTLSILNTLKERAVNAANDSNISGDRAKIAEEVRQLVTQIDENANRVKFNGRVLLNGAGETSDTSTGNVGTIAPNAVTASGTYGNMAVYSLTGIKANDGAAIDIAKTTLVSLTDEQGNALFQAGDRVSLSWTENGVKKEATVGVKTDTVIDDVLSKLGGARSYKQAGEALAKATDANGTPLTAGKTGVYYEGAVNKNISNIAIGITSASGNTRAETQAIFELNPIQQSYGDEYKGSNKVYNVSGLTTSYTTTVGGTAREILNDNDTEFWKFGTQSADNGADKKDSSKTGYKLTINDKTVEFAGTMSINQINDMLKDKGIDVRLDYAVADNDKIQYDGENVTKGSYGGSADYKTPSAGLKIIAGPDQEINTFKIEATITYGVAGVDNSLFKPSSDYDTDKGSSAKIKLELLRDDTEAVSSSVASAGMLPRGQELQFFVGGEQNFGVNFAIGKATSQNLLGMSTENFANMFTTKDGANSAIGIIDNAISKTLTEQTRLGAMEARLGYTSDNLVTMNENLESGVAAYTGSDMAKEMTEYMKYSVVSQAAQYMLANAGQNAYNVLQLLQP